MRFEVLHAPPAPRTLAHALDQHARRERLVIIGYLIAGAWVILVLMGLLSEAFAIFTIITSGPLAAIYACFCSAGVRPHMRAGTNTLAIIFLGAHPLWMFTGLRVLEFLAPAFFNLGNSEWAAMIALTGLIIAGVSILAAGWRLCLAINVPTTSAAVALSLITPNVPGPDAAFIAMPVALLHAALAATLTLASRRDLATLARSLAGTSCPACGYSTDGLSATICPECGSPLTNPGGKS